MKSNLMDLAELFRIFFLDRADLFRPDYQETMKLQDDKSYVGSVDRQLNDDLTTFVGRIYPLPVISEETPHTWPPSETDFWLIDPRDGTNNKKNGLGELTGSQISLFRNDKPVFTFIFIPSEERSGQGGCYFAVQAQGVYVWKKDDPVRIFGSKNRADISNARMLVEGPSRKAASHDGLRRLQFEMAWRINIGCAWTFTRFALGHADAVAAIFNKPTDTLHGILFAEEVGGTVTDFEGNPPTLLNCNNLLYSKDVALHHTALSILNGT
jgi:fructose-1,6-bisphosphatase/inositol monophosphatase family enzyme